MKRLFWLAAVLIVLLMLPHSRQATFDGSRVANSDRFTMQYRILNGSDSHVFSLESGDGIDVSIVRDSGQVAVLIGEENADPIYRGIALSTSAFQVSVPKSGSYRVTVIGKKASGSVNFTVKAA